jgi:hypothetical protein
MSINIQFIATREIKVVKTGKTDVQEISFPTYQTPTEVTFQIKNTVNPVQAYKDWVMQESQDEVMDIYAEDDLFEECDPVGTRTFNPDRDHCERFDTWLKEVEQEGYEVNVQVW